MAPRRHVSFRIDEATLARLEGQAKRAGATRSTLAERYLAEAVRMADHPAIAFRTGGSGIRRACLVGRRLDVWHIVETYRAEGTVEGAAESYGLRPGLIAAALAYYEEYPGDVDDFIREERAITDRAMADVRRRAIAP